VTQSTLVTFSLSNRTSSQSARLKPCNIPHSMVRRRPSGLMTNPQSWAQNQALCPDAASLAVDFDLGNHRDNGPVAVGVGDTTPPSTPGLRPVLFGEMRGIPTVGFSRPPARLPWRRARAEKPSSSWLSPSISSRKLDRIGLGGRCQFVNEGFECECHLGVRWDRASCRFRSGVSQTSGRPTTRVVMRRFAMAYWRGWRLRAALGGRFSAAGPISCAMRTVSGSL